MSNHARRRARRRTTKSPYERWMADRYRPVRNYTTAEVRKILTDDGIARRTTPMMWFLDAIEYISAKDKLDMEVVFQQINGEVMAATGLPLPTTGLAR